MPEETSCKATKAIIQYIRYRAEQDGEDASAVIQQLLTDFPYPDPQSPYTETFLSNIDNWVELKASDELFARARVLLRDEEITYKIAAATPQFKGLFGVTEHLARVVGPEVAMQRTPRLQRALQRTSHLELKSATASQAEIRITYHQPYRRNLRRDSCDFARGILSAVPQFAGSRQPATLRETHCTIPIFRRGIIDGHFYVKGRDRSIWRFVWSFTEGDDQIPLPAEVSRHLGRDMFEFKTRQGATVSLLGQRIGQLNTDESFEWDGVRYGAESCSYHLAWQPKSWPARWLDALRFLLTGSRAREVLAERQHRLQEMAGVPASLSLAVVFDDIVKRLVVDDRVFKSKIVMLAQLDPPTETLIVRAVARDLWEAALTRLERTDTEVIGRFVSLREHHQNLAVKTILRADQPTLAETDDLTELFSPLLDPATCRELTRRVNHLVTIPLRHNKHLVGNLFIGTGKKGSLTPADQRRLLTFAEQAAAEIWNASRYERRVQELEALQQIDQTISSTLNLDEVLHRILAAALRLTKVEAGQILLMDEPTSQLVPRAGQTLPAAVVKSEIKIPLSDQDRLIGEMQLQSERADALDEDDERLLRALAGQAVIAIKNAQQFEELSRERDRRINAEVLSAMIDLSGKMVHRMRGHLGGARSDLEEIRAEYISEIRRELKQLPASNGATTHLNAIEELLDDISAAVESALSLMDDLRKPFKIELKAVNINQSLERALSEFSTPPGVSLDVSESITRLPPVRGSVEHLSEVFHILLTNALEAMPTGGRIRIRSTPVQEQQVTVQISDSGSGMDRAVMARIFNYGFTTKTTEKQSSGGYGFGLWWVKRYLQRIEGDIYVNSTPGEGSQFTLVLPIWTDEV